MKPRYIYDLVALAVLALSILPVGTAVFVLGFAAGDSPCVMCWEQRIGMILVSLLGLFVLRYGPKPKYVGLAVLVAGWGAFMATRHTATHAARDVGQGFSLEILGAHTYTWAFLIYWICIVTMGLLLMLVGDEGSRKAPRDLAGGERVAFWVFLVVVAANAVQAFASTGPAPFLGQSDPVRFSFNPAHWVWSLDEWKPSPVSLRGRWAIEKPDPGRVNGDPTAGPLSSLPELAVLERRQLALPLRGGAPTGLAYDSAADRFAISTALGVHLVDAGLAQLQRYTVIDPGYSVDLGRLSDVAFLDAHTIVAVSENKSYVTLRESDHADARRNYRFFLDAPDRFDELSRSRLTTVRARMMYTLSAAFEPSSNSLYTVSVPNNKVRRLVVSRFDRADMTLSEEFVPALDPAAGLQLRDKRTLDELYVTAATARGGVLYALSAAYRTLLAIDLVHRKVIAAYIVPATGQPVGVAVKGTAFFVLCSDSRLMRVDGSRVLEAGQGLLFGTEATLR